MDTWEEFIGGVPCQGCGRPFLGDETSQREPAPTPVPKVRVRLCGTCHKPLDPDHVCQLEDLPKRLRAIVEAVLARQRERAT